MDVFRAIFLILLGECLVVLTVVQAVHMLHI